MDTAAFDYTLPPERIAQRPLEVRDAARLLVDRGIDAWGKAVVEHRHVRDVAELVRASDVVVVNNTRVMAARLDLRKPTGGAVEVLLLERLEDGTWDALVRPGRRVGVGVRLAPADGSPGLIVEVLDEPGSDQDGRRCVRVHTQGNELEAVQKVGRVPLPPYITETLADPGRYQTVYAAQLGSVAAPTAGLHFTPALLDDVRGRGTRVVTVELVVGLDTFRPIATDCIEDHVMHGERYRIADAAWDMIAEARAGGGRVIAVGTTSVRALESAHVTGCLEGRTDLYITPGFAFGVTDALLTNFHLPRSSLLVLLEAFVGPHWRALYEAALAQHYRFLSFGDAMFVTRGGA